MASRFIHLHTHSHYSFLQALPKVDELVEKARKEGMDALALTDAGNMHGAIEFYKAAVNAGIKPILGVDAYLAPRSRHDREPNGSARRSRIVLLAENNEGYKNLLALVTKSWTEGFFERPRIDKELLPLAPPRHFMSPPPLPRPRPPAPSRRARGIQEHFR